mgnify:CR=1 FL=1
MPPGERMPTLRNLSFELRPGQALGVVGPGAALFLGQGGQGVDEGEFHFISVIPGRPQAEPGTQGKRCAGGPGFRIALSRVRNDEMSCDD